jgi:hypothetical protein
MTLAMGKPVHAVVAYTVTAVDEGGEAAKGGDAVNLPPADGAGSARTPYAKTPAVWAAAQPQVGTLKTPAVPDVVTFVVHVDSLYSPTVMPLKLGSDEHTGCDGEEALPITADMEYDTRPPVIEGRLTLEHAPVDAKTVGAVGLLGLPLMYGGALPHASAPALLLAHAE